MLHLLLKDLVRKRMGRHQLVELLQTCQGDKKSRESGLMLNLMFNLKKHFSEKKTKKILLFFSGNKIIFFSSKLTFQSHVFRIESNKRGLVHVAGKVLSQGFWVRGRKCEHLFVDRQS